MALVSLSCNEFTRPPFFALCVENGKFGVGVYSNPIKFLNLPQNFDKLIAQNFYKLWRKSTLVFQFVKQISFCTLFLKMFRYLAINDHGIKKR
jgi:hypothetical protein